MDFAWLKVEDVSGLSLDQIKHWALERFAESEGRSKCRPSDVERAVESFQVHCENAYGLDEIVLNFNTLVKDGCKTCGYSKTTRYQDIRTLLEACFIITTWKIFESDFRSLAFISSIPELLSRYPQFIIIRSDGKELEALLRFTNWMKIVIRVIGASNHKKQSVLLAMRIAENRVCTFGGGIGSRTQRRVEVYRTEGGVLPNMSKAQRGRSGSSISSETILSREDDQDGNDADSSSSQDESRGDSSPDSDQVPKRKKVSNEIYCPSPLASVVDTEGAWLEEAHCSETRACLSSVEPVQWFTDLDFEEWP